MKYYRCGKCCLTFDETEITTENEDGLDLCPACGSNSNHFEDVSEEFGEMEN